jgi:uncharacterized protein
MPPGNPALTGEGPSLYSLPFAMATDSPFVVETRDLPTHRKFDVPPKLVEEALAGLPMREALEAPEGAPAGGGAMELDLYADGTHVFATGQMKAWLEVACSRCIGPVKLAIDEPVRVTFMPRKELAALGSEDADPAAPGAAASDDDDDEVGAEVGAADLDVFPYDGEKVDLEPLIREQFVLAVPFAPLCKDDCAGLCAQCGIDKNQGSCACEAPPDPRFAALRGLKLPS